MSSTFLTRLRIGEKLVDAKGVSRLYNPGSALGPSSLFLAAFAILLAIVVVTSPALERPRRAVLAEDQDLARALLGGLGLAAHRADHLAFSR